MPDLQQQPLIRMWDKDGYYMWTLDDGEWHVDPTWVGCQLPMPDTGDDTNA